MRRLVALAVAALSLGALALLRSSGGGPPLYDGLCTPPAYRLLGHTPPPPSRSMVYNAAELSGTLELADDDTSPQAQIIVGAGTFSPAPGASTVTLTITPVKAPALRPSGSIDGNVYDIEAVSAGRPVQPAANHPVTIVLGSTSSSGPSLTVEHLTGSHWTAFRTLQSGCGSTFDAAAPTLGLFALVSQGGSSGGGGSTSGGPSALLFILGAVVVLGLVIVAVRASRARR